MREELAKLYCEADVDWRCQDKEKLAAKTKQAGEDGVALLRWLEAQPGLSGHKTTALLKRVLEEQFETEGGNVAQREKEESGVVKNPHDPDAQWSTKDKKKEKQWVGYKVQVAETVGETPAAKKKGDPTTNFITDVTTTEAIASDKAGMERSLEAQRERGLEHPSEHFVDGAYVCGETMASELRTGGADAGGAPGEQGHLSDGSLRCGHRAQGRGLSRRQAEHRVRQDQRRQPRLHLLQDPMGEPVRHMRSPAALHDQQRRAPRAVRESPARPCPGAADRDAHAGIQGTHEAAQRHGRHRERTRAQRHAAHSLPRLEENEPGQSLVWRRLQRTAMAAADCLDH